MGINVTARKTGGRVVATLVKGDNRTTRLEIVVPRMSGGVDMADLAWAVNIGAADGRTDVYVPQEVTHEADAIRFEWLPGGIATAAEGLTEFSVIGAADAENPPVWQSAVHYLQIDEGVDAQPSEEQAAQLRELDKLIVFVQGALDDVIGAGEAAASAADRANAAAERAEGALDDVVGAGEAATRAADRANAAAERAEGAADASEAAVLYTAQELDAGQQAQARHNIGAADAEEVMRLSEEIQELKGNVKTTEVSGKVLAFDCKAGAEVAVSGETTETVTLIHCGKNLMPNMSAVSTSKGVTATPNANGTITFSGTATGETYPNLVPRANPRYLPAGVYTITGTGLDNVTEFSIANLETNKSVINIGGNNPASRTFTLESGVQTECNFIVRNGATYDNRVMSVQLEFGGVATAFEAYSGKTHNVALPTTLAGYNGTNVIYTTTDDALTAKVTGTVANSNVDWAAFGLPIIYLKGDTITMTKDDAVELSYEYRDMLGTVSVKWQGSSSLKWPKKNYTFKFDNAFEAKEGWGAQTKYCFKANYIDHTHARNLVCASIWGELVKSAVASTDQRYSLPNGGAVDGFPCIIMLNGEFHGLYTWNIPKDGWMLGMGSGTQECILCARGMPQPNADGFQTLETALGTAFDVEYITDESNTDWALTSLNRMLAAVINSDGSDLDTTVAQYLDWASVIDHYIQTVLTGAADCTFKNYLLCTYDGTKWFITGYDMDSTFGLFWDGKSFTLANAHPTFDSYAYRHRAMDLVLKHKKDELKARYTELRAGALSEINISNMLTNYMAGIPSQVLDADAAKWPTIPSTSASNLAQMLNWYRLRVAVADAKINAL